VSDLDAYQQEVDFADNHITQMVPSCTANMPAVGTSKNKYTSVHFKTISAETEKAAKTCNILKVLPSA